MKLADFDYDLPAELIAQEGLARRDEARMMVLCEDGTYRHDSIKNLPSFFRLGDLLVLNNTRVVRAKMLGRKETGGKVDCMVLPGRRPESTGHVAATEIREALIRGSRVRAGMKMIFEKNDAENGKIYLRGEVTEKLEGARYKVRFDCPDRIESFSSVPLPPYIKKPLAEPDRYQTIYAAPAGSLAAPTAGLHFTQDLINKLKQTGVEFAFLTLHIGTGTFAPIRTENVEDWKMESEYFEFSAECAEKINRALEQRRRIFAVGTTTVRALESVFSQGKVRTGEGWTDIFVVPGSDFKFPYAGLLTNFHLPKSTLILLVCAFAGTEKILSSYKEAVREKYRFYSFGDAMFIFR